MKIDFEAEINALLEAKKGDYPDALYSSMRYALLGGGKRIRPSLCFLSADFCHIEPKKVLPLALAIECIHSYSLIHDDMPCMDNDSVRRDKPTVHVAFGEAMALLCGDALLNLAYEILFDAAQNDIELLPSCKFIASAAGGEGMIGGQVMEFDGTVLTEENLIKLDGKKTGKLIEASVMSPAFLCYDPEKTSVLSAYAKYSGLAFQLADDLLDMDKNEPTNFATLLGNEKIVSMLETLQRKTTQLLSKWGAEGDTLLRFFNSLAFRTK